jgi:hypothetical protein
MSVFHGHQDATGPLDGRRNKGVMARRRAEKREQAEARNAATPLERTRAWREGTTEERLLMDLFGGDAA